MQPLARSARWPGNPRFSPFQRLVLAGTTLTCPPAALPRCLSSLLAVPAATSAELALSVQ